MTDTDLAIPDVRKSLDKLLSEYPLAEVIRVDTQQASLVGATGPWVCVDLVYRLKAELMSFAIWKNTGDVYRIDAEGRVTGDPIIFGKDL